MQFSLQSLLLSAVVIWSSLAVFGVYGIVFAIIMIGVAAYIRAKESMIQAAARVGCAFLCLLVCVGLCLPLVSRAREPARRTKCMNHVKQIGLGLLNYESAHGHFPPAYTTDAEGNPMHSWRVLILPYMEGPALFQGYDFNEPWNGPNNRKLAGQIPPEYFCPSQPHGGKAGTTNYVAVVGPKTVWSTSKETNVKDVSDETRDTILIVEVANSDIHWMEPRDLTFEEVCRGLDPQRKRGISSPHIRGDSYFHHGQDAPHVAFVDGSVRPLRSDVSPETLKALLTIDGGESIDADKFDAYAAPQARRLKWTNCIALVALLASTALLWFRPRRRAKEPITEDARSRETRN